MKAGCFGPASAAQRQQHQRTTAMRGAAAGRRPLQLLAHRVAGHACPLALHRTPKRCPHQTPQQRQHSSRGLDCGGGAVWLARAVPQEQEDLVRRLAQDVQLDTLELPGVASSSASVQDASPSLQLAPGTQLQGGRYTITRVLGTGGSATTYQATSSETGGSVAIKALSLKAARDWKQLTLFQREAQTLKALSHPGIPRYVDYFEVDSPTDRAFYLVQEEVAGKSLAQMVAEGARCSTDEATRVAVALCEILTYLSSLHPPVVHRDVKPENIVLEGGRWGGRVYLVDFGGVVGVAAAAAAQESFMSTVVGTYGYMAPEQFRGAAQPASDAYALGATLLFLLSGRPPFSFPQERMRINWRGAGAAGGSSTAFQAPSRTWEVVLDGLLEPVAEDRLTPQQALDLLQGRAATALPAQQRQRGAGVYAEGAAEALLPPMSPLEARQMAVRRLARQQQQQQPQQLSLVPVRKPAGTRVQLERSGGRLDVLVPPKGLGNAETLMTGSFAIAWNAFVAVWTVGALASGGILMGLFSLPFWFAGFQLGKQTLGSALLKERMAIGRNKFRLGQQLALLNKDTGAADFLDGDGNSKLVEGRTADLLGARIVTTMFVNGNPQTAIELIEGVTKHRFGEGLDVEEQRWLVSEVNAHLEALRGGPIDYASFPEADEPQVVQDQQQQDPFYNNNSNNP